MSVIQQNQAFFPTQNGLAPSNPEKGGFIRQNITLGAGVASVLDMSTLQNEEILDTLQTLYIDNSTGANPVTIRTGIGNVSYTIPGYSQAILPTFNVRGEQYSFMRADAGTLQIIFLNMPLPSLVWSVNAAGAIVTVANTVAVSVADGADVALGDTSDAAETNPAVAATAIALLKGILTEVQAGQGSGGPVTIADGADVALGATTSAAVTNPATNSPLISFVRGILTQVNLWLVTTWPAFLTLFPASLGQGTMAQSLRVVLASDQSTLPVLESGATTGTLTVTAWGTGSVTIAAANAARRGGCITNASANVAYIRLEAAAASATNYTVAIPAQGYYELPENYRGEVRGFTGVATGNFNWTELT